MATSWNIGTATTRHPEWEFDYHCASQAEALVAAKRDAPISLHLLQGDLLRATFDSPEEASTGTLHAAKTWGHLPPGAFLADRTARLRVCAATDLLGRQLLLFPLHAGTPGIVRVHLDRHESDDDAEAAWEAGDGWEEAGGWVVLGGGWEVVRPAAFLRRLPRRSDSSWLSEPSESSESSWACPPAATC